MLIGQSGPMLRHRAPFTTRAVPYSKSGTVPTRSFIISFEPAHNQTLHPIKNPEKDAPKVMPTPTIKIHLFDLETGGPISKSVTSSTHLA